MKKLYLLLAAATLMLASCMQENLTPDRPADGQVTIKAVAAGTKTLLNGTDVVWENEDAIKLVFKGDNYYTTEFTTELEENSTEATFAGILDPTVTVDVYGEKGFAVYPSSVEVESDGQIEFVIPSNQNGEVTTGSNLSYSEISLASLNANGTTDATFQNALSLLKITVPQGVKSVTVASETPLAGTAPFYFDAEKATLAINEEKWYDSDRLYSVTLAGAEETLDNTKTYFVHVFPGVHESLTISVEGNDCSYSKNVDAQYNFEASMYYGLNIANIFNLKENEFFISPFGGSVDLPIVTTLDDYEVSVSQEGSWLTETPAAKGAFRKDVLSYTAAENTTGIERSATVTITSGSETLAEVTVMQKGYIPALINEYLESYTKSYTPYTGTLKIERTDDASQGVYKVTICGETRYADYAGGKLIIYDNSRERNLTVSDDYKTISADNFSLGYSTISNYNAILPLGEAVLTEAEQALVGRYAESWLYDNNAATPDAGVMQISVSDEASYGQLRVRFLAINSSYFDAYAQLDGNQLNVKIGGLKHGYFGEVYNPDEILAMTVNGDGSLTFASFYCSTGKYITTYKATKSDEEPVQGLAGTWFAEYDGADYSYPSFSAYSKKSSTIKISEGSSENEYIITNFLGFECTPNANPSYDYSLAAKLDGNTLTIAAKNQWPEMVFTYKDGKLSCSNEYEIAYQLKFKNIVATR